MNNRSLLAQRNDAVLYMCNRLSEIGIDYNPVMYYYTPLTMYPRSITPIISTESDMQINMDDFDTMFYIHIPYCTTRCTFCPFYLDVSDRVSDEFVEGLIEQVRRLSIGIHNLRNYNVYFGGGSPNLLSLGQIRRILDSFRNYQNGKIDEISIELHPEVINLHNYLEGLADLGISRISFGLEAIDSEILKKTARHHEPNVLDDIVKRAKDIGLLVNVDIMYGGFLEETLEKDNDTFKYVFSNLQPHWVTGYQVCIQEETPEFERFLKSRYQYPDAATILSSRSLMHQVAENEGYHYLGGDYFSKSEQNPNYQKNKWGDKNAVIAIGPGTYSYIINGRMQQGSLWWAPFDTAEYLRLVGEGKTPVERRIDYTSEDVESWATMSRLKRQRLTSNISSRMRQNLEKLSHEGFLDDIDGQFTLTESGVLIEDLVLASLIPRKIWETFESRRKLTDYIREAKYDWFFEPEAVLKFQGAIGVA